MQGVVREMDETGLIGTPPVIKSQRHSTPSRPGTRREGGSDQQRRFPGWYNDLKLSGDLIVENAIHNLDACDWLAAVPSAPTGAACDTFLNRCLPARS